ncbi:MAG: DUF1573 domain-containing protein, partial [Bacteroidia bacterium]|nr:DUF1573 domain-containing protein [Bacteroidia bacterium]
TRSIVLKIRGEILPRPKGITDWYPTKIGNLRFSSNHLSFGPVKTNSTDTTTVIVYNESSRTITVQDFKSPKYIVLSVSPKAIPPTQTAIIKATLDGKAAGDYGFITEQVKIFTDDSLEREKTLFASATIEEYFPPIEDSTQIPQITFESLEYNFGKIRQGEKVSTDFVFKNTGKQDLIIRKTKSSCGCTVTESEKKVLKPGESSRIKVTYDSFNKSGNESKTVTVISNAPKNPVITLKIHGFVEVPSDPSTLEAKATDFMPEAINLQPFFEENSAKFSTNHPIFTNFIKQLKKIDINLIDKIVIEAVHSQAPVGGEYRKKGTIQLLQDRADYTKHAIQNALSISSGQIPFDVRTEINGPAYDPKTSPKPGTADFKRIYDSWNSFKVSVIAKSMEPK